MVTRVTILILIDGFLQLLKWLMTILIVHVTILILIDGFLQYDDYDDFIKHMVFVTILILIDGFLQCVRNWWKYSKKMSQSLF